MPAQFGGAGTVGAINGARLPWTNTLNLRVDKDFKIGGPNGITVNGYLRISNLLDARNLRGVYSCLLYTSPSPRDATLSRMPSSA